MGVGKGKAAAGKGKAKAATGTSLSSHFALSMHPSVHIHAGLVWCIYQARTFVRHGALWLHSVASQSNVALLAGTPLPHSLDVHVVMLGMSATCEHFKLCSVPYLSSFRCLWQSWVHGQHGSLYETGMV